MMKFYKDSLESLKRGEKLPYEDACVWAGALYEDWVVAPNHDTLYGGIMETANEFLKNYAAPNDPEKAPALEKLLWRYTPGEGVDAADGEKPDPDYEAIFSDEHAIVQFTILAHMQDYRGLLEDEKNQKDVVLARRTGLSHGEMNRLRGLLVETIGSDNVAPPSEGLRIQDVFSSFWKSITQRRDVYDESVMRQLYVEAFEALVDDKSPLKILSEISSSAVCAYEKEQQMRTEERLTQGRSNRRRFADVVEDMAEPSPPNSWERLTQGRERSPPKRTPQS